MRIDRLAGSAGLSERQFARRFTRQVGLAPKLHARTVRLNAVRQTRQDRSHALWTELAHAAGYADQAHFARECRVLTGAAPSVFFPACMHIAPTEVSAAPAARPVRAPAG